MSDGAKKLFMDQKFCNLLLKIKYVVEKCKLAIDTY